MDDPKQRTERRNSRGGTLRVSRAAIPENRTQSVEIMKAPRTLRHRQFMERRAVSAQWGTPTAPRGTCKVVGPPAVASGLNLHQFLSYALKSSNEATLETIQAQMTTFVQTRLGPRPSRNVSDERSRDALGLMGLTTRKLSLNSLTSWL